jgi:cysteine desulfurase
MDANATTPLLPEVFEAMRPFFIERFGNPSSIHQHGQAARGAVEQARMAIARTLHCLASEIVFTSGGTESDNLALFGTLTRGDHLITSAIEHHAVLHAAEALEKRGVEVTYLPCTPDGLIEPATLAAALRPSTRLVSIMFANNETGAIQPIAELARIAKTAGALFHTDAVQAGGKHTLDLSATGEFGNVDLLSLSGHKMYAPQGVGILFVRKSIRLAPLFHGGTHERQRRAGTENLPGIVALGKAAQLAQAWIANGGPERLAALRDRLEQGLLTAIPASGVNGAGTPRTANTTNLYFDHVEAEALVIALDLKGLSVSGGSACQSGAAEPSHVLTAMQLTRARARASIRISLSKLSTEEDVDFALSVIPTAVERLRSLSPNWPRTETVLATA